MKQGDVEGILNLQIINILINLFSCWMDTGDSIWILAVPVVLVISVNILIVINVIRIIKRNRNLRSEDR